MTLHWLVDVERASVLMDIRGLFQREVFGNYHILKSTLVPLIFRWKWSPVTSTTTTCISVIKYAPVNKFHRHHHHHVVEQKLIAEPNW